MKFIHLVITLLLADNLLISQTIVKNQVNKTTIFFTSEIGYSTNFSNIYDVDYSNSENKFTLTSKPLHSLMYSFGVELNKTNYFFGLKVKRVNIGNKIDITSKPDSLNSVYSLYNSVSKTNYSANLYIGYIFKIKKIQLKPSFGLDYFLTPKLDAYYLSYFGNLNDSVYINSYTTFTKKTPLLITSNFSVGLPFTIKNRLLLVSYNFSYSYGFSNLYSSYYKFSVKSDVYFGNFNNSGNHLSQSIKLGISLNKQILNSKTIKLTNE